MKEIVCDQLDAKGIGHPAKRPVLAEPCRHEKRRRDGRGAAATDGGGVRGPVARQAGMTFSAETAEDAEKKGDGRWDRRKKP